LVTLDNILIGENMYLDNLSESDLFGVILLKLPEEENLKGYYRALFSAEPLLRSSAWIESVTGYYLNVGDGDSLRISYFTSKKNNPAQLIDKFIGQNMLEYGQKPKPPGTMNVSLNYGGEELRFRRFLSTYAPIGLDIMVSDLLHAQCLFATFRFQVMLSRKAYRPHFEATFLKKSNFYQSLSSKDKEQFWSDMSYWPNPPQVDWAHMFVNMVLGRDWPGLFSIGPRTELTYEEINNILREARMDFQIPLNWDPLFDK
jgi:hypothetical protein